MIGDLKPDGPENHVLLGLHEVAHAASDSDTLATVYTRSRVTDESLSGRFGYPARLWGNKMQASIAFFLRPYGFDGKSAQ